MRNAFNRAVTVAVAVGAILLGGAGIAVAGDFDVSGYVAGDIRWFPQEPTDPQQLEDVQLSLVLAPEFEGSFDDGRQQWRVIPFFRLDSEDDERTHPDLREGFWQVIGSDWDLLVGVNKVFWGVTESRHLVDIVNQDDGVEDIDGEDKLGQPMINVGFQRDWGRVDLFLLPGFRERTFAGVNGRPRFPFVVDTDAARFESTAEERRVDAAVRYSHFVGSFDIGASYFTGTGREPRFEVDLDGQRIIPLYDVINQVGVDLQYTREAWLLKLEAIGREGQGENFAAAVGGFEYTFFGVKQSAIDIGVLLEYLWDGRDTQAQLTPFDNDVFAGTRLAFNDIQDTSLLAGVIVDRADGSTSGLVELSRRLPANLTLEVEARFFTNVDDDNVLAFFERDSFLNIRLARFF